MQVEQRVRQFIHENFFVEQASSLADDASLIGDGIIDSTGVLELIAFLETEYSIKIADTETIPENLDSVRRIADFVASKRAGPGPS